MNLYINGQQFQFADINSPVGDNEILIMEFINNFITESKNGTYNSESIICIKLTDEIHISILPNSMNEHIFDGKYYYSVGNSETYIQEESLPDSLEEFQNMIQEDESLRASFSHMSVDMYHNDTSSNPFCPVNTATHPFHIDMKLPQGGTDGLDGLMGGCSLDDTTHASYIS